MRHDDALTAATPARRILVIDDEPGIRSFISRALSAAGFAVDEAANGHQGLMLALSDPPDLVLLDLCLPDLDGREVLRRLHQERPHQAVIVWSATSDRHAQRQCLSLGARDYVRKPVPMADLLTCIGACP